jgi:hypothetical protein
MDRSEKVRKIRKWFMVLVIAWVFLGVAYSAAQIVADLLEGGKPFQPTVFSEFFACEGRDPITGRPQEPVTTFSLGADAIYLCGHLKANGSVRLQFVPIYEGEPEGWFILEEYRTGYVFEEFPVFRRKLGHYRIEVHMGRAKLASTEFRIVP